MRRIAFIATNEWVPWGGSELCWATAAEKLARGGNDVRVSVKDWGKPVQHIEQLREAGCRIILRPARTLLRRASRKMFLRREVAWDDVRSLGTGAELTVISQGGNNDGLPWAEAAKAQKIPYALIVQSLSEQWWPADNAGERQAACYEGALAAYFVSHANLELTRKQFATPLERGRVIRNPFNVRYDAAPPWPQQQGDGLRLACVARLDVAQKGQELLLDVLSLPHWRSRDVRVTFVGSGMNAKSLPRLATMARLESVEFAGFVDGIENLWSQYHALILPSRFEGLPLALVEAMLCGRAAIVTDVAGHRELVRDNVNGFLAKAPTVELLDEAMNRAWENRHRLREMGEQAGHDVRQWVGPDPVEDFVQELFALADASRRSRE